VDDGGYPRGTRVVFLGFGEPDPYSDLQEGTEGTVLFVDSTGTVHVKWDSGSRLGMVLQPGEGQKADRIARAS
jgi:hypothetical protein